MKHVHAFKTLKSGVRRCACGAWRHNASAPVIEQIKVVGELRIWTKEGFTIKHLSADMLERCLAVI